MVWFITPSITAAQHGVLVALGGRQSTQNLDADDLYCEVIYSWFSNVFQAPKTSPKQAIKYTIDLLYDSVPPGQ